MLSHHPPKFGGDKHCGSGYMMFLMVEGQDWKHTAYHINNSDPGHVRLKYQLEKNLKIILASPSKKGDDKEKEKK